MSELYWRKSTFSNQETNCVEVAPLPDGGAAVRDTKDRSLPPHLFDAGEWAAFIKGAKDGQFDF